MLLVLFLIANWATRSVTILHLDKPPAEVQAELQASKMELGLPPEWEQTATSWLRANLGRAVAHPDDLASAMRDRAESFAFAMLPISALILAAIFAFRRGFVLFDHFVFSMHSLAFLGLLISVAILTHDVPFLGGTLLLAAPVHLFAHMRGVYATGVVGTLLRMSLLFTASSVAFALLLVGLILMGLQGMHA